MDSSKWRDQASTRARSESISLFSGSSRRAARRVVAAASKSFRSLASRAARSASSERALISRANAIGGRANDVASVLARRARRKTPALPALGVEIRRASLITGIHSLERVPDEHRGPLDPL